MRAISVKPVMRKMPKQERAQSLVAAVKQTCRKILLAEIDVPLTTTALANLSGVSVGSLYQYFPNVEAVVASVYEDLALEQTRSQHDYAVHELSELPVEEGLSYIISAIVSFHQRMLVLNPDFHRKYHEYADLNECFNLMAEDGRDTNWIVTTLIQRSGYPGSKPDIQLLASLVIEVIRTAINVVIRKSPDTVFDASFEPRMLAMCLGLLDQAKT
jgi:AcrR family transcriptional regulator